MHTQSVPSPAAVGHHPGRVTVADRIHLPRVILAAGTEYMITGTRPGLDGDQLCLPMTTT